MGRRSRRLSWRSSLAEAVVGQIAEHGSGAVQNRAVTLETDATKSGDYGWTGREGDVETGLQYNRARWYDPTTGRWMTQDPLGFDAGDSNLYRYVTNRATMATDPSGNFEFTLDPSEKTFTLTATFRITFRPENEWTARQKIVVLPL